MLEGKGRFINLKRKTANKIYDNFFVYVPVEVARDSSFPFRQGDRLVISVDRTRRRVIIEKSKE